MEPKQPERTDTAVSPVIRGEPVDIPTPVWGALVEDDLRRIEAETAEREAGADRPKRWLGWLSVLGFVATAVLHAFAVHEAGYGSKDAGNALAWAAIVVSVASVAVGVAAAALGRGRWIGIVGAVGALLANPWVVLQVLRLFAA